MIKRGLEQSLCAELPNGALDRVAALTKVRDRDPKSILVGPGRNSVDAMLGPKSTDFPEQLRAFAARINVDLVGDTQGLPQNINSPFRVWMNAAIPSAERLIAYSDGYSFVAALKDDGGSELGLGLINGDEMDGYKLRGLMIDGVFSVDQYVRNLGFGSSLVAAQLLFRGGMPNWSEKAPSYNNAGFGCMMAGLRLAESMTHDLLKKPQPDVSPSP